MDETAVIDAAGLDALIQVLRARGYRVVGPTVRDGAIVHAELRSAGDLPTGWHDSAEPGRYRLEQRGDEARFGYAVGPHSWKQFLFPPRLRLWRARRNGDIEFEPEPPPEQAFAFLGVRPCDLAAIAIQDRVLMGGTYVDTDYAAHRERAFIVAVDCGEPAASCFCASMGTGPGATSGFDLALTEVEDRYVVRVGSERGAELLAELPRRPAVAADTDAAAAVVAGAEARITRTVDAGHVRERLLANLEHPRWDEVANRCLSCANCTLVCPTCFCTAVEDTTDLTGAEAERTRVWDTCFSVEHAYVAGGSVRPSGRSRYRQWLTHKFATWHDQFGTSGCTGCGRCITWCPVGIDVTEEVAAIGKGVTMKTLDTVVLEAPIFAGLDPAFAELLAGCSTTAGAGRGETIVRQGERADTFWIIRHGRIGLELYSPNRGGLAIETLEPGDVLGWSWLFPPYVWHYDARALEEVRAVEVDGACLRGKCDADPAFGYEMMRRFSEVMLDRLEATRLRLLDVYGVGTA